jgi:hypothetical protein
VWSLAVIGIVQEIWLAKGARVLSLVIYVVMGWLALLVVSPLLDALTSNGFAWLVAGGVLYSVGVVFYVADRRLRHSHGVWHLFVLGGSSVPLFYRTVFCCLTDWIAMNPSPAFVVPEPVGAVLSRLPAYPGSFVAGHGAEHGAGHPTSGRCETVPGQQETAHPCARRPPYI